MKKAIFHADAKRIADYIGIGLASPPWEGVSSIDASRVKELADKGDILPPSEQLMGHDLVSQDDHERRMAYFLCHKATHPLTGKTSVYRSGVDFALEDGHHRLFAAIMSGSKVAIHLTWGSLTSARFAIAATHGAWLSRPDKELIGEQLFFAYPADQRIVLEVTQAHDGRVWINTVNTGECVARYNQRLWSVVPHDQLHSDHLFEKKESGDDDNGFFERFIQTFIEEYRVDDPHNLLALTPTLRKCYA